MSNLDYTAVTEIAGEEVTIEQVHRMARRYYWAGDYCAGKKVLEVACGAGQGIGYLGRVAASIRAGDYSMPLLRIARRHYGDRFALYQFDAQAMPFADGSFDVIILFEAIYYIQDLHALLSEVRRLLRPGGTFLIASANKDLYDFNPSPHSYRYLGVAELGEELTKQGFDVRCYGDTPLRTVSQRQRILRPVKAVAARLGLIPRSMSAKRLMKRFVFGDLVPMPPEISPDTAPCVPPAPLAPRRPDRTHKVILCSARMVQSLTRSP